MIAQAEALALTLAIEAPIVWLGLRGARMAPFRLVLCLVLPTCLSHPVAWHTLLRFGPHDYMLGYFLVEGLVIVAEMAALKMLGVNWIRAAAISLLANILSALAGWLIFWTSL